MRRLYRFVRSDLFLSLTLGFVGMSGAIVATNPAFAHSHVTQGAAR